MEVMETEEATMAKPPARRTRLVRVDQEIIDLMLKEPPGQPLPAISDEVPDRPGKPSLRAIHARAAAIVQRIIDRDADILNQYRTKGYAEVEEELTDSDEDVSLQVERKSAAAARRRRRMKQAATREN